MRVRLSRSRIFVLPMHVGNKSLLALGLAVLMVLSSSHISPVVADQTALNLPSVPVIMEVSDGTQSYFDINLTDVPEGYDIADGTYPGWCVDTTAPMLRSPAIHQVRLYSSVDPPSGELAAQNWTMVNYILNNKQGNAQDIQEALWYFVNFGTGYSPNSTLAKAIIDDTLANGTGFVPGPGQVISVICFPMVILPDGSNVQVTVIELRLPLIGDITGPDNQSDGRVDMRDIAVFAKAFGASEGDPRWNPDADITGQEFLVPDGIVDMRDIGLVAKHFGDQIV